MAVNIKAREYPSREELDQAITARSGATIERKDYLIEGTEEDLDRLGLDAAKSVWGVGVVVLEPQKAIKKSKKNK